MPSEFTIKSWKPWMDRDNPEDVVRDTHGNFKGSVTFDEYASEPVDATFKTEPNIGDKKYGDIVDHNDMKGK